MKTERVPACSSEEWKEEESKEEEVAAPKRHEWHPMNHPDNLTEAQSKFKQICEMSFLVWILVESNKLYGFGLMSNYFDFQ